MRPLSQVWGLFNHQALCNCKPSKPPYLEALVTRNPKRNILFISEPKALAASLPGSELCPSTEGSVGLPWCSNFLEMKRNQLDLSRWRELEEQTGVWKTPKYKNKWVRQTIPSQTPTPHFWVLSKKQRLRRGWKDRELIWANTFWQYLGSRALKELTPKVKQKCKKTSVPTLPNSVLTRYELAMMREVRSWVSHRWTQFS